MVKKQVRLVIDGEIWLQVPDFCESTTFDRHFVIRRLRNGHDIFIFGNGKNGARPSDRYDSFESPYKIQESDDVTEFPPTTEPSTGKKPKQELKGIYRAVVISNEDTKINMRVQVKIDAIPEMGLLWASPVVPLKENERILPAVGELVWISFRDYDPKQPLWLGKITEESPPKFFFP